MVIYMPRALVASFGFDERFVVRAIIRHGIGVGDLLLLITSTSTEKTLTAYNYVKDLASKVGAQVELLQLGDKVYSFPDLVTELKRILLELLKSYDGITILLSGGMRVLVLGLYTAALLIPQNVKERISLEIDTEDRGIHIAIPNELLYILTPPDLGARINVLRAVVESPGLTIEELSQRLGKDESTIRRQIQTLAKLKLITIEGSRPQRIKPTQIAKTLLS